MINYIRYINSVLMPDSLKYKNRDLLIELSLDLKHIKRDISLLKSEMKVLSDYMNVIRSEQQQEKTEPIKQDISNGWFW